MLRLVLTAALAVVANRASPVPLPPPPPARALSGPKINGKDFPDPSIIQVGSIWYSFATQAAVHVQVAKSSDFNTWAVVTDSAGAQLDALPNRASWIDANASDFWAPNVSQLADGSFIMYYSARTKENTAYHCIGAATSQSITGPYTDIGSPLICNQALGGDIDPASYTENGQRYLLWKVDGNSLGRSSGCGNDDGTMSTPIRIQQVAANGLGSQAPITNLLDNCDHQRNCESEETDNGIIESPSLVKVGSTYFLFFSSGCYSSENYKIRYATSTSLLGPYTRNPTPLFETGTNGLVTPGGGSIAGDGKHFIFHANRGSGRALYTDVIDIAGNKVST